MPAIPEPSERLSDGVVELRGISEWDIPEVLIAHQDDPRLHVALGLDRPPSGAQLGSEVERAQAERLAGTGIALTIVAPGSDDCIGRVGIRMTDWSAGTAELTVWVAPQRRGQGVARRALALVADWLLGPLGMRRLVLSSQVDNPALRAAAVAAGFKPAGSGSGPGGGAPGSAGGGDELAPDPRRLELQR